jgi:hypothetical protein
MKVVITEILRREVEVEDDVININPNMSDTDKALVALNHVYDRYQEQDIVLTADDFVENNFSVLTDDNITILSEMDCSEII